MPITTNHFPSRRPRAHLSNHGHAGNGRLSPQSHRRTIPLPVGGPPRRPFPWHRHAHRGHHRYRCDAFRRTPGTLRTCDRGVSRFPRRIQSKVPSTPSLCLIRDETETTPACPSRALRETQTTRATRKTPICSDSYEAGAVPVSPPPPPPQTRAAPVSPPPPSPRAGAAPVSPASPPPQGRAAPLSPARSSPRGSARPRLPVRSEAQTAANWLHDGLTTQGRLIAASTHTCIDQTMPSPPAVTS